MRISNDRDLGLVIRERRKQLGLDQSALAAQACVGRQWIVEVEKGKPRAEVALLLRTLRVLGLELRAELPRTDPAEGGPDGGVLDIEQVLDRARRTGEQDRA